MGAVAWRTCPVAEHATGGAAAALRDRPHAASIAHPAVRSRFLAARALLLRLVAETRPELHGGRPEVAAAPSGRPLLTGRPDLDVSLAHTRGLAAAALSPDGLVGVDVEPLGRADLPPADAWLTPRELDRLTTPGGGQERDQLLLLWVAKEAALKACGPAAAAGRRRIEVRGTRDADGRPVGAGPSTAALALDVDAPAGAVRTASGSAATTSEPGPRGPVALTWYEVDGAFLVAVAMAAGRRWP